MTAIVCCCSGPAACSGEITLRRVSARLGIVSAASTPRSVRCQSKRRPGSEARFRESDLAQQGELFLSPASGGPRRVQLVDLRGREQPVLVEAFQHRDGGLAEPSQRVLGGGQLAAPVSRV